MEKLKILVVDDCSYSRRFMVQAVEKTALGGVEHTASSSSIALERLKQCQIDVVIYKVSMMEVNGIEFLKLIKKEFPSVSVIIVSNHGASCEADILKGLQIGAMDFIIKPLQIDAEKNLEKVKNHLQGLFTQIIAQKYTSGNTRGTTITKLSRNTISSRRDGQIVEKKKHCKISLVVIASSTGGPAALETICNNLPANFNKPVLIIQHMPAEFTKKLAQALDKKCALPVVEAVNDDPVKPGLVMIAPGGIHMTVQNGNDSGKVIKLEALPPMNGVRPSADILFSSVAKTYKGRGVLVVILTGMGSDGTQGVKELKKCCDCYCLVQSERTCVVYGMPKKVVEAGLSDDVVDIEEMPTRILQAVQRT